MAFGKTDNPKVTPFRQLANKFNKSKKKESGGLPYFIGQYRPGEDASTVRLVAGRYPQEKVVGEDEVATEVMPYVAFCDHFDGANKKSAVCSAGVWTNDRNKREPCHGCDIYWATIRRNTEGRTESSRMSRQNKFGFSVVDYGAYHKVEQTDFNTGEIRKNSNTGEPYYNWAKCQGENCDACRAQKETKYGHRAHFPVNWTELQVLLDADAKIGKSCTTCQQANCIRSLAWACPSCGEVAIDTASTSFKKDEIRKLTDNEYTCKSCRTPVLLDEVYECSVCIAQGMQSVRASLFDVDLQMCLVQAGEKKILQINGWTQPYPFTLNPIIQQSPDLAEPLDLLKIFAPTPLSIQEEKFGITTVPVPGQGKTAPAPAARAYSAPAWTPNDQGNDQG